MRRYSLLLLVLAGAVQADAVTRFVSTNSPSELSPYTNWAEAAHTIQAALDVSVNGDEILVTNGVYSSGGVMVTNFYVVSRVSITNVVTVRSVNGPSVTTIKGQFDPFTGAAGTNAVRCVLIQGGGKLIGFTLAGGATATVPYNFLALSGGGLFLYFGTVSNCVITGCRSVNGGAGAAFYSSGLISHSLIISNVAYNITNSFNGSTNVNTITEGGGVYMSGGELRNCLVTKNSSEYGGGGLYMSGGRVDGCTVSDNTCTNKALNGEAGGVYVVFTNAIVNSIVYGNHANAFAEYYASTNDSFSYSCSTPLPTGPGNFAADPEFLGAGDFHIAADSPCINAGTNQAWMSTGVDMDDEPRIQNGIVDVGADEALDFSAVDISKPTNAIVILWSTPSNDLYRLQYRTNLITGVWSNLGAVSSSAGFVTTVDTNPFHPYRLYRLITN